MIRIIRYELDKILVKGKKFKFITILPRIQEKGYYEFLREYEYERPVVTLLLQDTDEIFREIEKCLDNHFLSYRSRFNKAMEERRCVRLDPDSITTFLSPVQRFTHVFYVEIKSLDEYEMLWKVIEELRTKLGIKTLVDLGKRGLGIIR